MNNIKKLKFHDFTLGKEVDKYINPIHEFIISNYHDEIDENNILACLSHMLVAYADICGYDRADTIYNFAKHIFNTQSEELFKKN